MSRCEKPEPDSSPANPSQSRFATTHWSVVLAAGRGASPQSNQALESLCQAYWYPLYAFVRRQGQPPHDAQDSTQEFFARVLEKNYLIAADRDKGRFRSFLLTAFQHFLSNERDQARAKKRGGGCKTISLDVTDAETRFAYEASHASTPEREFQRRWAWTLLERVLTELRKEFDTDQRQRHFDVLKTFLTGEDSDETHADAAEKLGMTPGAVKVAVHRLRRRYRDLLRDEIAHTVAHSDDIDDEIRELFSALGK